MESRFHGVPISATQKVPEAAASYRGITIRAPLTVDESEFEYSFSPKSQRNSTTSSYYSGSELESEGYESGENEVKKDEEFGQEGVDVSKNDVFRPFVRIPDGKMYKESSNVDDSDDSGSFLSDSDDELVKDEIFVANLDDSRPLVAVIDEAIAIAPVVDVRIPLVQKLHIPIAQISADSDDDSQISGVSDEEGFSGIVRIPSIEILRRIDSIPKVRISESAGNAEKIVEMEFVDDLIISDADLGSLDEMKDLDATSSVNCSVSADLVLDKGLDIDEEDTTNSLVVDEEFESGKNGNLLRLGLEIQESDEGNRSEKVESENEDEIVTTAESFSSINCSVSADLAIDNGLDIDEEEDRTNLLFVGEEFDSTLGKNRDLHLGLEIQESDVIVEGNRSKKVEGKIEHEIVTIVDPNTAHKISSVHQCVDILEVPTEACPESPKPLAESMTVEDTTNSSVVEEELDSTLESRKNGDHQHLELKIQGSDVIDEGNRSKKVESENKDKIVVCPANFEAVKRGVLDEGIIELSPIDASNDLSSFLSIIGELHEASSETNTNKIDLHFSLSILVIGTTGVGKSATINSIFGETKVVVDAFEPGTSRVKDIFGTINGVKLKVFDTPGLRTCSMDQSINRKILSSIKKVMQKSPPDVILYVDRLDNQISPHDLKSITTYLGSSMWQKSIVVFTHGGSVPPDGPHGCPLRYGEFVDQQSRAVRQIISHSMVPVFVVENRPFLERIGHGKTLLLNGERWRSEFLILCCSMKILAEFKNVPPNLLSSFLQPNNVVSDQEETRGLIVDDETGGSEMWVPPSFRHRFLRWHLDFPAVTVQFTENVTASFNKDKICVRARCSDLCVAALSLVPIVKKILGQDHST